MEWMVSHGNMGGDHSMYLEEGFECPEINSKTKGRHRKKLLYKTVLEQMEFYFSDANLSKDRFLCQLVETDPYVPLEIFLKCNRINALVSTVEEIAKAVMKSETLALSDDSLKVRRLTPIKMRENEDDCTLYVENLSPEISHEELKKVFSQFGKVVYVSIPKYRNTNAIKGFAFVEFETPKDAEETVRIFKEKGSCLSPLMLPEKLCSIRTFEDQNMSQPGKDNREDFSLLPKSEGNGLKTEVKTEDISTNKPSNKRKLESEEREDGEKDQKIKKGKKLSDVESKCVEELDQADDEQSDLQNLKHESTNNNSGVENDTDETSAETKKKKNRKKKKRPKEKMLFANGMVVLSKKEWKRLRNKYLNIQRVNMRRVKQQVLEARFMRRQSYLPPEHARDEEMRPPPPPIDAPKARFTFVPGVIVSVKFTEPVADVKAFKAEAKTQPGVQYVDLHEGAMESFIRCSGPAEAQHLIQLSFWKNMSLLTGAEESEYWNKISRDREAKLGNKVKVVKERGKKKLLRKAEIVKATHLHFEN